MSFCQLNVSCAWALFIETGLCGIKKQSHFQSTAVNSKFDNYFPDLVEAVKSVVTLLPLLTVYIIVSVRTFQHSSHWECPALVLFFT